VRQDRCRSCNATGVCVGTASEDCLPCYLITLSSYLVSFGLRLTRYILYGLVYMLCMHIENDYQVLLISTLLPL